MAESRRMKLGVFVLHGGYHLAGWRHPDAESGGENLDLMIRIARIAEAAHLDMLFFADVPGCQPTSTPSVITRFEPLTLLSALSASTRHIGLAATASTTYYEPMNLARMFASLDHLSGGRAAWNVVTTLSKETAGNFSQETHLSHGERYERAGEFVDVVHGLWDSWEEGAFVRDKESGRYIDPDKLHLLDHKGRFLSVAGPLNVNRTPQGRPLTVVAGASAAGRQLAGRVADLSFTAQNDLATAQAFYRDVKARAQSFGRSPDQILVVPGVVPVIGRTRAEARELFDFLQSRIPLEQAIPLLSFFIGHDVSGLPLDQPLPDLGTSDALKSRTDLLSSLAHSKGLTVRELARAVAAARGHLLIVGTPADVADTLETWFRERAADGFNVMPPYFPGGLEAFTSQVVPILRERGLFRREYEGSTLRENLGLPRPENRYTLARRGFNRPL